METRVTQTDTTGWHKEDIKAAVWKRGMTLRRLATENHLPECACRVALVLPYRRAELAISKFLGVSPRELWPDRWDDEGRRLRKPRSRSAHNIRPRTACERQKREAA